MEGFMGLKLGIVFFVGNKMDLKTSTIIDTVCTYYDIKKEHLLSKAIDHETVHCRKIAMYFVRTLTKISYQDVGECFDRNESTVYKAIEAVESSKNKYLLRQIREINYLIHNPMKS